MQRSSSPQKSSACPYYLESDIHEAKVLQKLMKYPKDRAQVSFRGKDDFCCFDGDEYLDPKELSKGVAHVIELETKVYGSHIARSRDNPLHDVKESSVSLCKRSVDVCDAYYRENKAILRREIDSFPVDTFIKAFLVDNYLGISSDGGEDINDSCGILMNHTLEIRKLLISNLDQYVRHSNPHLDRHISSVRDYLSDRVRECCEERLISQKSKGAHARHLQTYYLRKDLGEDQKKFFLNPPSGTKLVVPQLAKNVQFESCANRAKTDFLDRIEKCFGVSIKRGVEKAVMDGEFTPAISREVLYKCVILHLDRKCRILKYFFDNVDPLIDQMLGELFDEREKDLGIGEFREHLAEVVKRKFLADLDDHAASIDNLESATIERYVKQTIQVIVGSEAAILEDKEEAYTQYVEAFNRGSESSLSKSFKGEKDVLGEKEAPVALTQKTAVSFDRGEDTENSGAGNAGAVDKSVNWFEVDGTLGLETGGNDWKLNHVN